MLNGTPTTCVGDPVNVWFESVPCAKRGTMTASWSTIKVVICANPISAVWIVASWIFALVIVAFAILAPVIAKLSIFAVSTAKSAICALSTAKLRYLCAVDSAIGNQRAIDICSCGNLHTILSYWRGNHCERHSSSRRAYLIQQEQSQTCQR